MERNRKILENQIKMAITKEQAKEAYEAVKEAYAAGLLTEEELDILIPLLNASSLDTFEKQKYGVSETVQSIITKIESGAWEIAKYLIDKFTPLGVLDFLKEDDETIANEILVNVFGYSLGAFLGGLVGQPLVGAIVTSGVINVIRDAVFKVLETMGISPEGEGIHYSSRAIISIDRERRRHSHFMRDPLESLSMEENRYAGMMRAPLESLSLAEKAQLLADPSTPDVDKEELKDLFGEDLAESIENNPDRVIDVILRKIGVTELLEPIKEGDWNQVASVIIKHWVPFIGLGYVLTFVGVPFLATKLIGGAGWIAFLDALERKAKKEDKFQKTFGWD